MSKKIKDNGIQFFGELDRKGKQADGAIASEYPAWYFITNLENLKEEIANDERRLGRLKAQKIFDPEQHARMEEDLQGRKEKYERAVNSRPKLGATQKDEVWRAYQNLGGEIREALFTRSQMNIGSVDPHEEVRRMTEARIPVTSLSPELAKNLGVKVQNGKISRSQAERAWKILGRSLGEETNIEALRKDRITVRGRG